MVLFPLPRPGHALPKTNAAEAFDLDRYEHYRDWLELFEYPAEWCSFVTSAAFRFGRERDLSHG